MILHCYYFISQEANYICGYVSHKLSVSQMIYVSPFLFY